MTSALKQSANQAIRGGHRSTKSGDKTRRHDKTSRPELSEYGKQRVRDPLLQEVDMLLKQGADAMGATYQPLGLDSHGPVMKALLVSYSKGSTLATADETEEHPLFPTGRSEPRTRVRQTGKVDGNGKSGGDAEHGDTPREAILDAFFRRLDPERFPLIKESFDCKGGSLNVDQFVAALLGRPAATVAKGSEEGRVAVVLQRLHAELAGDGENDEEGQDAEAGTDNGNTFLTAGEDLSRSRTGTNGGLEGAVAEVEALVTWDQLAQLFLDNNIIAHFLTNYKIADVLSHMDLDKINQQNLFSDGLGDKSERREQAKAMWPQAEELKEEFMHYNNAVNLEEFVAIMKTQFRSMFGLTKLFGLEEEEKQLIAELVGLFETIDFRGNNVMSWEDFTTYIVDQGMTEDVSRVNLNTIRFSQKPMRFDLPFFPSEKAFYFKGWDKVAYVEQGCKTLKLCTPDMQPAQEVWGLSQVPICAEFCADYQNKCMYLAVACSDRTLSFFDVDNSLKLVRKIETRSTQLAMCWSEMARVLFTADHEGRILPWDISKVKAGVEQAPSLDNPVAQKTGPIIPGAIGEEYLDYLKAEIRDANPQMRHRDEEEEKKEQETRNRRASQQFEKKGGATSSQPASARLSRAKVSSGAVGPAQAGRHIVTQLLELPVLGQIASCGVDRNIMIWDVFTGHRKKILRGSDKGHEMGVKCMAFSPSTKFLVTGGYDYNLFVWNPYVGKAIFTMKGHLAPIVGVEVIGYNQVVSADADGYMRTWDLGTFQCIQVIEILTRAQVEDGRSLKVFISVPSQKRVLAVDRKFLAYEYQNTGKADQTDDLPIIKAFYHPRLKVFVTGTALHVRIWDAVTGAVKCEISQPESDSIDDFSLDGTSRADIADFCLDDLGRKLFLADSRGIITVINSETGVIIKKMTPHQNEVSGMVYCPGDKNLITVSWDKTVIVHDESEQSPNVWRQAFNIHNGDVSCMSYSRHFGLIATGSSDCVISIRDYARLRGHAYLLGHKCNIGCLSFIEPFRLLASADSGGNVAIWEVPSFATGNTCVTQVLTRFVNMQTLESSASVQCLCPLYEADTGKLTLHTGDEDGDVRVWDLTQVLEEGKLSPVPPQALDDHRRKDSINAAQNSMAMAKKAISSEVPELQIRITRPTVRQVTSFKAHTDSIRSLEVYRNPDCVLSAGYDHMVKIWSLEGSLMTVLRAYGSIPWTFPVRADRTGIDDETLDRVMHRVKELEAKKLRLPKLVRGASKAMRLAKAATRGELTG